MSLEKEKDPGRIWDTTGSSVARVTVSCQKTRSRKLINHLQSISKNLTKTRIMGLYSKIIIEDIWLPVCVFSSGEG